MSLTLQPKPGIDPIASQFEMMLVQDLVFMETGSAITEKCGQTGFSDQTADIL
jgi:hypothetical protein